MNIGTVDFIWYSDTYENYLVLNKQQQCFRQHRTHFGLQDIFMFRYRFSVYYSRVYKWLVRSMFRFGPQLDCVEIYYITADG